MVKTALTPIYIRTHIFVLKIAVNFQPITQFLFPLRFRIYNQQLIEKGTHTQTDGHVYSMKDPALGLSQLKKRTQIAKWIKRLFLSKGKCKRFCGQLLDLFKLFSPNTYALIFFLFLTCCHLLVRKLLVSCIPR